eukprot:GHVO01054004.1.p1 GENE.GHVO01054004.1~~GHVO01054004.1.p1  ORF type:complete len:498 (+),score=20.04 GHVO01054004.1:289-1782(+)
MIVDGLPAAVRMITSDSPFEEYLVPGFPIGSVMAVDSKHLLYNHLSFAVRYHLPSGQWNNIRIIGFEVEPKSMSHVRDKNNEITCTGGDLVLEDLETGVPMAFSYSVEWIESPMKWATRWDVYLQNSKGETDIHWFSIVNSLMIVLFLSAVVAMILLRTLLRDIASYNSIDEEAQDESGWKLVHADVFRRPQNYRLLAVCAGTGVQIFCMLFATLVFAAIGILSPTKRGLILQSMLVFFALMGLPAGYVAARIRKFAQKDEVTESISVTFMTAFLFPGVCFAVFFVLNLMIWRSGSSGAVSFGKLVVLLLLWFGVSVPAVYAGAYIGQRQNTLSSPVRTLQIPREIPPARCLSHPLLTCGIGGILPFGAVFTELIFIMTSLWYQQFYYLFGFLALVLIILVITCAEISIAFTYFQLVSEDYRWWWRSFWYSGTSALYVFIFSIVFVSRLGLTKAVSIIIYFGYMSIVSYGFMLLTGSIGFLSTFIFVRAIYGSIKVD